MNLFKRGSSLLTRPSSVAMIFINVAVINCAGYWWYTGALKSLISPASMPIVIAILALTGWALIRSYQLMYRVIKSDFIAEAGKLPNGIVHLEQQYAQAIESLKMYSLVLSTVGLIATIYGFMRSLTLESIASALGTDSTSAFQQVVIQLAEGTGIALQATFISACGALLLVINIHLITKELALKWSETVRGF